MCSFTLFSYTYIEITYTYIFSIKKLHYTNISITYFLLQHLIMKNFNRRVKELFSITSDYLLPTLTTNILLNFITYSSIPLFICQSILIFLDPFQSKLQTSIHFVPFLPNTSAYISLTRVQCWFTGFLKR